MKQSKALLGMMQIINLIDLRDVYTNAKTMKKYDFSAILNFRFLIPSRFVTELIPAGTRNATEVMGSTTAGGSHSTASILLLRNLL